MKTTADLFMYESCCIGRTVILINSWEHDDEFKLDLIVCNKPNYTRLLVIELDIEPV